jgi:glutaredoxin-like protein NrdH
MAETVVVYSQAGCPNCYVAIEYLSGKGVAVQVRDIRRDPAALQELLDGGFQTTPVIKIGDEMIAGFDPTRLDAALAGR